MKSGDFREDSGIYFSIGELTCLFDVDANSINFNKLPNVDVYASSFAGGASGYPLMFDNYTEKEQSKISKNLKDFVIIKKSLNLKKLSQNIFFHMLVFLRRNWIEIKRLKI